MSRRQSNGSLRRFARVATRRSARLATITQPTLVVTGMKRDPHTPGLPAGFYDRAADAIAASVPNARRVALEGQTHVADPRVVASMLGRFFVDGTAAGGHPGVYDPASR